MMHAGGMTERERGHGAPGAAPNRTLDHPLLTSLLIARRPLQIIQIQKAIKFCPSVKSASLWRISWSLQTLDARK